MASPLKMRRSSASVLFAALITSTVSAAPLLVDSFESGDLSATNADGFQWSSTNRTGVVTENALIYNKGPTNEVPAYDFDWAPKHGAHSLRFEYPPGKAWSEQRFKLGDAYRDIWFQYWVRVPVNYYHGQKSPTNNKFFSLWMDGYSSKGNGPSIAWEFWGDPDGSSRIAFHYSSGGYTIMGSHRQIKPFISVPRDRGRWMEVTIHVKAASSSSSNDGVIEFWRRWEDESPDARELLHRTTSADIAAPPGGPNGWAAGYLMGWANAEYAEQTDWLIDYFTISTESLINSQGIGPTEAPPEPPTLRLQ
ncbi:hypothetical protein LPB19_10715 [Marinobacter salinisoli]|uniref:Uncharacterized protein n=1 Tax=Marinobacter salinisoli TaxID=2769486 RepID=A0ABX7MN66_9GAMM|nr:hypothetical protein [Marinobacter salinisoli]QSP93676.1 hypothetical protein LPB19_10715 [Marinobacter salinisoli]